MKYLIIMWYVDLVDQWTINECNYICLQKKNKLCSHVSSFMFAIFFPSEAQRKAKNTATIVPTTDTYNTKVFSEDFRDGDAKMQGRCRSELN